MDHYFQELRECGRKIDEGIEYLESKLADPYSLSRITPQSASLCEKTINEMDADLSSLLETIQIHIKKEQEELDEARGHINSVEDFLEDLYLETTELESSLRNNPNYVPFSKPMQTDTPSAKSEEGMNSVLKDISNCDNLIGNESPNFISPNYNSTPDTASSSRYADKQWQSGRKSATPFHVLWPRFADRANESSRFGENTFRTDSPCNESKFSNRSFLRNHIEPIRAPAILSSMKNVKITSPEEPECSFQVSSRLMRGNKKNVRILSPEEPECSFQVPSRLHKNYNY